MKVVLERDFDQLAENIVAVILEIMDIEETTLEDGVYDLYVLQTKEQIKDCSR